MKTPKCPLCGNPLKLSIIKNKGQLHFYACYKCNYQLRMSPRKDFALEYAKAFVSLFPPFMRIHPGDKLQLVELEECATVVSVDIDNGKIYTDEGYCYLPDVVKWPWELEQKGGAEQ